MKRNPELGWRQCVLQAVEALGAPEFSLDQLYELVPLFKDAFPDNRHVEEKIRQQLQVLRDDGILEFLGDGRYLIK